MYYWRLASSCVLLSFTWMLQFSFFIFIASLEISMYFHVLLPSLILFKYPTNYTRVHSNLWEKNPMTFPGFPWHNFTKSHDNFDIFESDYAAKPCISLKYLPVDRTRGKPLEKITYTFSKSHNKKSKIHKKNQQVIKLIKKTKKKNKKVNKKIRKW